MIENVLPGKPGHPVKLVWPVMQMWNSRYWAVFDVDFSKSETQLVNEFREWLRHPENQKRLEEFKKPKAGMTGQPLDRLKDLAAWRLYRELSNDWNAANDFANQNRKHFTAREIREKYRTEEQRNKFRPGNPKPFRDAKTQGKQQPNEADLFGEDADARKAKANAWEFLTEIMPREFASPRSAMLEVFVELKQRPSKG